MKIILMSAIAILSAPFSTFAQIPPANTVQYIDCHFDDLGMEDRVIVSLVDANNGTFFYSTGLDPNGEDTRTPPLKMKRVGEPSGQSGMALFKATHTTDRYGQPVTITFMFGMPKAQIFKASDRFKATVDSSNGYNGGLICFSRLYPKN